MPYLYILKNEFNNYYTGITKLDPKERLSRHNKGYVRSTKRGRPWIIIHTETFSTLREARRREKQIKSWKSGNALKKLLSKVAGLSNLPSQIKKCKSGGASRTPA